jgi:hypothetical protein
MKKPILLITVLLIATGMNAQTLIATSNLEWATSYRNQRKIVRDSSENIYVVFTDFINSERIVKGVMFDNDSGEWGEPGFITSGSLPTIAISDGGKIHLVYRSNDETTRIMHISSDNFSEWTEPGIISDTTGSCTIPGADVDSTGNLNVFWVQENTETGKDLIYCRVNADTVSDRKLITTKEDIFDIAMANHLQYMNDDVFFALHFTDDSLQFFHSVDLLDTFDTIHVAQGSQPNITFNSIYDDDPDYHTVRFLYRDMGLNLMEYESWMGNYQNGSAEEIEIENVDYVCIDDVLPDMGYSYLYLQDNTLYHNFSYGPWFNQYNMEIIYGMGISYPNIAYKHFNPLFVDFIWMEENYKIYYMRDEKHVWMPGYPEIREGEAFSISGTPNPFSNSISIIVNVYEKDAKPNIQIYTIGGNLIKSLEFSSYSKKNYTYIWDGTNNQGTKTESGIYLVVCTVGKNREARKIMLK